MTDTQADPMPPRWLEYVRVTDLPPDPANAKGHDGVGLAASMDELGFIEPVTLDERTGMLVSGHGRREQLAAAEAAGGIPPEGIVVDADGRWTVPVSRGWASEDDAHARVALVALNRIGERGGWRRDPLAATLEDLRRTEPQLLELTGYTSGDLDALLASLRPPDAPTEFPDLDPDALAIDHRCPRCGYEWAGPGAP